MKVNEQNLKIDYYLKHNKMAEYKTSITTVNQLLAAQQNIAIALSRGDIIPSKRNRLQNLNIKLRKMIANL